MQRLRINHLYLAPTALRLLLRYGDSHVLKYDRSSLRTLGVVGEPINHEAWEWYNDVVGEKRCPIVDTWWQTETGGVLIAPTPKRPQDEIVPAMPMTPFFGINPVIIDAEGVRLPDSEAGAGALCVDRSWPGIARSIYGDDGGQRWFDTYFSKYPGYYFSGDGAERDADGHYRITGRMDDVINISGHRLGTAEVEDVLDQHSMIAEAAVVGFPHAIKGEALWAYVVPKTTFTGSANELVEELRSMVKTEIAAYARPDVVQICDGGLPKTRSGKIMRRILRKLAQDGSCTMAALGDISTLNDPSVVEDLITGAATHHAVIKRSHAATEKRVSDATG